MMIDRIFSYIQQADSVSICSEYLVHEYKINGNSRCCTVIGEARHGDIDVLKGEMCSQWYNVYSGWSENIRR
jgi:hypothetical protein